MPLSPAFFLYYLKRKKEEGEKEEGKEKGERSGGVKRRKDKRREVLEPKYVLNKYF